MHLATVIPSHLPKIPTKAREEAIRQGMMSINRSPEDVTLGRIRFTGLAPRAAQAHVPWWDWGGPKLTDPVALALEEIAPVQQTQLLTLTRHRTYTQDEVGVRRLITAHAGHMSIQHTQFFF